MFSRCVRTVARAIVRRSASSAFDHPSASGSRISRLTARQRDDFRHRRRDVDVLRGLQHDESCALLIEEQGGGEPPLAGCRFQRAQVGLQQVEQEALALAEVSIAGTIEGHDLPVRGRRGQPDHQLVPRPRIR